MWGWGWPVGVDADWSVPLPVIRVQVQVRMPRCCMCMQVGFNCVLQRTARMVVLTGPTGASDTVSRSPNRWAMQGSALRGEGGSGAVVCLAALCTVGGGTGGHALQRSTWWGAGGFHHQFQLSILCCQTHSRTRRASSSGGCQTPISAA